MPITIQLTGATAQEVAEMVAQLAKVLPTIDPKDIAEHTVVSTLDEPVEVKTVEVKEPVKETKPKKQEPKAEAKVEPKAEPKPEQTETFTLESVRSLLSTLSQSGKQAEVKELIASMGATKLTEIDPSKFAEIMDKARALA